MMRDWIKLNVGGQLFLTTKMTIVTKAPGSMLARMFEDRGACGIEASTIDDNGAYMIDRSPKYFEPLINFLRTGKLIIDSNVNVEGVLEDARYFGFDEIIPQLEERIAREQTSVDERPLTRSDVVRVICGTESSRRLRFQGVNLAGADLSRLDLRHINFKYANMRGCLLAGANLCNCNLERADLSRANLDGAQLLGARMLCANMEGASLKKCNFEDPAGATAVMESANLKGADLEGSSMAGVNLRVATLKNANMRDCDLRSAVLAGADLEFCNLSGSDLNEANLRGANFKDTLLDSMQSPLHMSQTIR